MRELQGGSSAGVEASRWACGRLDENTPIISRSIIPRDMQDRLYDAAGSMESLLLSLFLAIFETSPSPQPLRALTSSLSSLSRLPSHIFSTRESLYLHTLPPLRFVQPQLYKRHPKPHRSLRRRILSLTTRPLSERAFRILHPPFCHPQIPIAPILHRPLLVPIHSARLPRPRNHSVPLLRSMGL